MTHKIIPSSSVIAPLAPRVMRAATPTIAIVLAPVEPARYKSLFCFSSGPRQALNGCNIATAPTQKMKSIMPVSKTLGIIFLTKGLVDSLENEDELAAVLAHEVAHINNRDGISTIEASRKSSLGTLFLKEPFRIAGTITPAELSQVSNLFIQAIDSVFDTVAVNGYSDTQELEADKVALVFLTRSGYDPSALLNYRTRLADKGGSTLLLKMENNPSPFERVENIKLNLPPVQVDQSLVEARAERFHTYVQ